MNLFVVTRESVHIILISKWYIQSNVINNEVVSLDNASFQMVREFAALDRIYAYIGYYITNAQQ